MMSTSAFLGLGTGLECDGRRIGAVLVGTHDRDADLGTPSFQLVGGRRAEGIGSAQHDLLAFGNKQAGKLARSGGFARAVHTDHDDDAWFVRVFLIGIETAIRVSAYELQQLVLQRGTHFGRIGLACDSSVVA